MNISIDRPAKVVDGGRACVAVDISSPVQAVVSRLGRTEDIRFSPDNRRLAIAGYAKNSCFLFDIRIDRAAERPTVGIHDYLELRSNALADPHGFDFAGDDKLIVANRSGQVTVFAIPERDGNNRVHHVNPLRTICRAGYRQRIGSPGSVCVVSANRRRADILVCNNYEHRITRHSVALRGGFALPRDSIVLENTLDIPDGIAVSPDRAWVAVSNHMTANVLIFDNRARLRRSDEPVGTLDGVAYPHGLRFSPDGSRIYVADAGAPFVHVYEARAGDWRGPHAPVRTVTVLDDETFRRGRVNPEEGGPKGVDVDASGEIMAVTCEERALAFFHVPSLFASG
ncbi:hypothetical protein [Oricola nitratireducens]|uniref:hypothetical protein n=1 Tax=Oricola nitratireducens TaxID=2775868 RepID=UPI001865C6A1|nr:hypothetical protein [Oricola nitratireducens]